MTPTAGPITSEPIAIPIAPFNPPATPSHASKHALDDPAMRPRSDTICTTSSSSSAPSFHLQTPQTPSILHVLGDNDVFSTSPDAQARPKKGSYGFGPRQESLVASMMPQIPPTLQGQETTADTADDRREEVEVEGMLVGDQQDDMSPQQATSLPQSSTPRHGGTSSRPRGIAAAVRRKVERSKSSFRSLKGGSRPASPALSDGSTDVEREERPRKHRLRTLLRSISHTGSTVSLRSMLSSVESAHLDFPINLPSSSAQDAIIISPVLDEGIISRDYVERDLGARPNAEEPTFGDDLAAHQVTMSRRSEGKERARAVKHRPPLLPSLSVSVPSRHALSRPPTSPIISRPRAMSMPYVTVTQKVLTTLKADLFGSMLPRELQVMVFKTLVHTWDEPRRSRWENEDAGRRKLVGLSRVSKLWQSLCFDGQLWTLCDLQPFASSLHPRTLYRIVSSTGPFISTLSLRGLDNLHGPTLVNAVSTSTLCSLTTIDLRGCRSLADQDICRLIEAAPRLQKLNLRGVQATSAAVIRCLARHAPELTELDIARCWDISLCDLTVWLRFMDPEQAASLRVLHCGGIKGYSPTAQDFLPLVASRLINMEKLDLQGCSTLFDVDFEEYAKALKENKETSRLTHLNLSNCVSISTETFGHLAKRLPDLTHLELASLPQLFRDVQGRKQESSLIELLRSMPRLQRLDLEGTGVSGHINDRLLDALTPARSQNGEVVGGELVELRLGYATGITPEGLIRLIRGCDKLRVLEIDNTSANNAVMRDFMRRRDSPQSSISLIDCRAITPAAYSSLAPSSRPRAGYTGWSATPFMYEEAEQEEGPKTVLKTFWSWKRVGIPKGWREVRANAERGMQGMRAHDSARPGKWPVARGRRGSWWRDDEMDERAGCVIM